MGRRLLFIGFIAFAVLGMVEPTFAQTTKTEMNIFSMFFTPGAGSKEGIDILGLCIVWFLLLMSAVNMGLIIKYLLDSRRTVLIPEDTAFQIESMLAEKRYREAIDYANSDPSYLGKITSAALNEASNGFSSMERALEERADAEATRLLRPCEFLNVAGNIAPMLGLFGTVYGMIRAFQALVSSGGRADPVTLAAGISTALVTTFWGLIVAMPALTAYALVRNKIDAMTAEGLIRAEELIVPFKPSGKKGDHAASSSGSGSRPRPTSIRRSADAAT